MLWGSAFPIQKTDNSTVWPRPAVEKARPVQVKVETGLGKIKLTMLENTIKGMAGLKIIRGSDGKTVPEGKYRLRVHVNGMDKPLAVGRIWRYGKAKHSISIQACKNIALFECQ